jgi:phenylacetate-CoA ligase
VNTARADCHFDARETRDPDVRERELLAALPAHVSHARSRTAYYGRALAQIDPRDITTRAALAQLPVTRKSEVAQSQAALPPFGGLSATAPGELARIFMSPGPVYEPEGRGSDYWRCARALYAAGFRAGDVVLNCFSYHLTPAGSMFESGLHRLRCAVIPGGVGQSELQARVVADIRPSGYAGTPSFLKIILEKYEELALGAASLMRAVVSGEAFTPAVRAAVSSRGIDAYQAYGTADLGIVAYESRAREGLILNEDVLLEIVRPGTGDPVPAGEVGEVVVTSFGADYPLIRFATGDLSAVLAGTSPCGRTNVRIKGWMGRADQSTKVRGLFVHPHQVAEVLRRHGLARGRLVVEQQHGEDRMVLLVESIREPDVAAIAVTIREVLKLRGDVARALDHELPNDGKVIEDRRPIA